MMRQACLLLLSCAFVLPALAAETRLQSQSDLGRRGTLVLDRAPIVTMQATRLELQLAPVTPAPYVLQGRCDLTMPAMPMPPNRPMLRPIGDKLVGDAIFTMAGAWRASCTVEYADRPREIIVFDLAEVLMK